MIRSLIVGLFLFALIVLPDSTSAQRRRVVCDDFRYQEDAQAVLARYPYLDRDKDGIACENRPHRPRPAAAKPARRPAPAPVRAAPRTAAKPAATQPAPAPARAMPARSAPTRSVAVSIPARMPDTGATDNYGLLFFTAAAFLAGGWFMRRRTV